jgi:hypothetical protein
MDVLTLLQLKKKLFNIHIKSVNGRLFFIKAWTLRNRFVILLITFLFNDCTIFADAEFTVEFSFTSDQRKKKISNKLAEKTQLVSSQQWNRPNDMFSLHTICFFRFRWWQYWHSLFIIIFFLMKNDNKKKKEENILY